MMKSFPFCDDGMLSFLDVGGSGVCVRDVSFLGHFFVSGSIGPSPPYGSYT